MFHLSPVDLNSVLSALSFIFEQSAYYGITPQVLALQIEKAGISTQKLGAFEQLWREEAVSLINKLRSKTVAPLELDTIAWRLHLQIGQSSLSRLKEPSAIFDLGLHSTSQLEAETSNGKKLEHLCMEFSHEELYEFFQKLEVIQEQLDNVLS